MSRVVSTQGDIDGGVGAFRRMLVVTPAGLLALGSGTAPSAIKLLADGRERFVRFRSAGLLDVPFQAPYGTATLRADGRVLLVQGAYRATVDPRGDTLARPARITGGAPRTQHAAVRLADGRIWLAGGFETSAPLVETEVHTDDTITPGPSLHHARVGPVDVSLADGTVLLIGGSFDAPGGLIARRATEHFDPRTGSLTEGPSLLVGRFLHAAVASPSGILVVGGVDASGEALRTTEWLASGSRTFVPGPMLTRAREGASAVQVPGIGVVVSGGSDTGLHSERLVDGRFELLRDTARWTTGHSAALFGDALFIAGGGSYERIELSKGPGQK